MRSVSSRGNLERRGAKLKRRLATRARRLAEKHANLIGIFLAVSSWNPTKFPVDLKQLPTSLIRDLPIFLSAGENDEFETKKTTDDSHAAMVEKGFKQVRYEHFLGGHQLNHPHLQAA